MKFAWKAVPFPTLVLPFFAVTIAMSIFGQGQSAPTNGAALYKGKCAMCHGQDGAGKTPMGQKLNVQDLRSEEVQKRSDAELAKSIGQGKGKMPGFDNKISPDDIRAIVSQIRAFAKK